MLTRTQLADIMDALSEARERFDAEADVEDGDYGLPRPNKAMRTVMKIDLAITLCLNEFDAPVERTAEQMRHECQALLNIWARDFGDDQTHANVCRNAASAIGNIPTRVQVEPFPANAAAMGT
jgi:hypothetical protein